VEKRKKKKPSMKICGQTPFQKIGTEIPLHLCNWSKSKFSPLPPYPKFPFFTAFVQVLIWGYALPRQCIGIKLCALVP